MKIGGLDYTIVGVTPPAFIGTELIYTPEIFVPLAMADQIEQSNWLDDRGNDNALVVGRLKPGVSLKSAEAAINIIATQLGREYPKEDAGISIVLSPPGMAGNFLRGAITGFSAVLMAVAGMVLLIACVNLASLLLARASRPEKRNRHPSGFGRQPRSTSAPASHREPDAVHRGRRGRNSAGVVAQRSGERVASAGGRSGDSARRDGHARSAVHGRRCAPYRAAVRLGARAAIHARQPGRGHEERSALGKTSAV